MWTLPDTITVGKRTINLDTDYRTALTIFAAYNDLELDDNDRIDIMIQQLIPDWKTISRSEMADAVNGCLWFLDGGMQSGKDDKGKETQPIIMDWEQDEQLVFSAVNKVAGHDIRMDKYLHWWTFLGYFRERGDCLLNVVMDLRYKRAKKKDMTKEEKNFWNANKGMCELKPRLTQAEKQELDELDKMLRGGQ